MPHIPAFFRAWGFRRGKKRTFFQLLLDKVDKVDAAALRILILVIYGRGMEQVCSANEVGREVSGKAAGNSARAARRDARAKSANAEGAGAAVAAATTVPGVPRAEALPDLVALRAVSNGGLKELPGRIKIFNWGENPSTKGIFSLGEKSLEALAANQRARGYERVALDYNHCSVPGSPEYDALLKNGQPPIIFGYGRPNLVRGDGLYLEEMEWTPLGLEKARNFEDLSPAAAAECGEIDFIHSVALTTNGCLHDVTFFSANGGNNAITMNDKTDKSQAGANGAADSATANTKGGEALTLGFLAQALALDDGASCDDVAGCLGKLAALAPLADLVQGGQVSVVQTLSALDGRLKAVEAAQSKGVALLSASEPGAKMIPVSQEEIVSFTARLEKVEGELRNGALSANDSERGKMISRLSAEGKAPVNPETGRVFSSEELRRLELPALRLLHANTPVSVPLSARTRAANDVRGLDTNLKGRARFVAAQELSPANKR